MKRRCSGSSSLGLRKATPACRTSPWGRRLATASHLTWLTGYQVTNIQGTEYAEELVVRGAHGVQTIKVDCIFVETGLQANSGVVANLVQHDAQGRIIVDNRNRTSRPGIFAAGDVTDVYAEQILVAVGEGAKAALSVSEYLAELEP